MAQVRNTFCTKLPLVLDKVIYFVLVFFIIEQYIKVKLSLCFIILNIVKDDITDILNHKANQNLYMMSDNNR